MIDQDDSILYFKFYIFCFCSKSFNLISSSICFVSYCLRFSFIVSKSVEFFPLSLKSILSLVSLQIICLWSEFNLLKESFGIFAQILIYLKNYSIFEKKRTELCAFSQFKIYPGHGKRVVKSDLRVSLFAFTKELLFLTPQFLTVIFFSL